MNNVLFCPYTTNYSVDLLHSNQFSVVSTIYGYTLLTEEEEGEEEEEGHVSVCKHVQH